MAAPGPPTTRANRPRKASTSTGHAGPSQAPVEPPTTASTPAAGTTGGGPSIAPGTTLHSFVPSNGPQTVADCEVFAAQLVDPAIPPRRKQELAIELRDSAENSKDYAWYAKYLEVLMPVVLGILGEEKSISFAKDSADQRLRGSLLTFLQRLPKNEVFKAHGAAVMELSVKLLRVENEENALLCIKIMIDAFRNHRDQAEPFVQPFLDCVKTMYANLRGVIEKEFASTGNKTAPPSASLPPSTPNAGTPTTAATEGSQPPPSGLPTIPPPPLLARALYSPKVLTECPIAVVLVFQTYKSIMAVVMEEFYPLVMDMIQIQPEPQRIAYEEAKAKGETFIGIANGISNREMFAELVKAQVKTMAFLAYVLRGHSPSANKEHIEVFPEACVRLLRNCPPEDVGTRKELLVATRHILSSDSRTPFIPFIDMLLDERVLVGTGITSRETLRPLAYSVIADLIHHVRGELPLAQLARVIHVMSLNLNDATFNGAIQTMCAKLLNTMVDAIHTKAEPAEAHRMLRSMFFTSLEKLRSLTESFERLKAITARDKAKKAKEAEPKPEPEAPAEDVDMDDSGDLEESEEKIKERELEQEDRLQFGWREIEQSMPVHAVAYASDSIESFCKARFLFKTLLHTFRTLLGYTRATENPFPPPDGEVLGQFFDYALRSLAIFEGLSPRDNREQKDAVEILSQILLQFEPHVFASVWTINMDQFFRNASTSPHFFLVLQHLIVNEQVSHQLVGILLKYLMNHMNELGSYSQPQTGLTLKLFKLTFMAINTFISINEAVLVPHLQKLILRCFECAAQAEDSAIYYQILRALFRSIGGGRFEALYKEVLPILQEMLDTLSHLLQHATDNAERDLFVELTLTVPVRLTNLLPHLSYLMKPLVRALRAGPESVSQGLRTLELCIDNLTADFLDPTMGPILRELMAALHRLLKPVPANRSHATSTIRILGKLGGRNRRFQEVDNLLEYTTSASNISVPIQIEGKNHTLELGGVVATAATAIDDGLDNAEDSFKVLTIAAMAVLQPDGPCSEGNETFMTAMSGLFSACVHPTLSAQVTLFVRDYCRRVFAAEMLRKDTKTDVDRIVAEMARKRSLSLTSAVSDCFVETLAKAQPSERDQLCELLAVVMGDFRALATDSELKNISGDPAKTIDKGIQTFVGRFSTLCHEADWNRKLAGVAAIKIVVKNIEVNWSLLYDLEVDIVRALLFCLRDAPLQAPKTATTVADLIQEILRHCRTNERLANRQAKLVETLVIELNSQSLSSRQCAQRSLATLAEITEKSLHTLIAEPARTKLLDATAGPIFSKPLRALPFAMQVGNIDAVTYLIEVQPPLIDTTEEFLRLTSETIALADVNDEALISKPATQKQEYWIKSLRVACLRLLRAAMSLPNFTTQQQLFQTRSRIVQVYFRHVYSQQQEIVEVAHEGLRDSLSQQHKLPKDLLQAGLRPILVNLADAKRLSVSGLDGLARFLELLTSYFKLEIGVKLLEHFQALGDPLSLAKAASAPLEDNSDIARMSRLVNVFRLLPDGAEEYLVRLTNYVVDAEALLHQFVPGPLTSSMAAYFDKYHAQGTQNLFENIRNPRFVWTYRNIIQSGEAPMLVEEISSRIEQFCQITLQNAEMIEFVLPGLQIIGELSKTKESWFSEHEVILEYLVSVWRTILAKSRINHPDMMTLPYQQIPSMILDLFMRFLRTQKHVPLLFHLVEAFEVKSAFERSNVAFFLYQQAALQDSVEYRREVLDHFFNLYEEEIVTWDFKANGLRLVVNPLLRMHVSTDHDGSLLPEGFTAKLAALVWRPLSDTRFAKLRDDDLLIEIFALTNLIVEHFSSKVAETRKDVFKLAWMGVNLLEPTVKLMAYSLAARFMATYDTPWKFVKLTWTGLLRLKDTENRVLYRQAIDTLATCLHKLPIEGPEKRVDGSAYPAHAIPEWAQRVRSVLIEEGHATSQLVTVCELLVNHPDQFYEYRELYVPHVANSLSRLAFGQTTTSDLKKLTVDIVELIFRWEMRRMAARDEAMEVDEAGSRRREEGGESPSKRQRIYRAGTAISTSSGGGWAAPTHVREVMTGHLLRLVSSSNDPVSRGGLTKRALDLFKEILGPKGLTVHVKMSFFSRTMKADITENTLSLIANSTEVIAAVAAAKEPREPLWVKQNLGVLTSLLEKVWVYDEPVLHATIEHVTDLMFKEMADEEDTTADKDAKDLYTFVSTAVNDGLQASLRSSSSLPGTLFLLRAWLKVQPKQMQNDNIASGLLKVLQNLAKVHTTNTGAPEQAHRLIISILDVIRGRVADLREHRRTLHGVIMTLIEKSGNLPLCRYLLDVMKQWVLDDPEPTSLGKEKAALLLRMASFEQREEALFQQYLDLVYDIYERDDLKSTDLTHRLEPAFLLGTRSHNQAQRVKFLNKLEASLPRNLDSRLQYLYSLQNWDTLSDSYWIPQILSMLLAVINPSEPVIRRALTTVRENDPLVALASEQTASDLITPTRNLIHIDNGLARQLWTAIFPKYWSSLTRNQQTSFTPFIIKLLSKDYHKKQVELRPNVIQTFLQGILPCSPVVTLPPLLVKYLAKSFDAWYIGFEFLHKLSDVYRGDDELRDSCSRALSELYAELCEDDMFYGLARSRCVFPETTAGLTYEQNGLWPQATEMYEAALIKARGGLLPFSEDEYVLWEDHWILAAQKLQNWDSLTELARTDQDSDLLLECAWRISDWGSSDRETIETNINRTIDTPTPRRKTFEAYTALLKAHTAREPPHDFLRIIDEAQQVTLRKWISLPSHTTAAHLPLLQMFQQCVELSEASQVFDSLQQTNQQNLEIRATSDLKTIFTAWRERLPNFWDDISVWSDLLAWRQHVFQAVTKVYVPLIPPAETATYGYRGYHETAWTINRFGEMARRHNLLDVCSTALNKIYSLPNIEISEAFLKLREQALCFFQKPEKFNEGLENISTTNLMYFTPPQKAEFLTLKGVFIAQLGQYEDANAEFAHAIQMDMNLPKAWAEWGKFNDKIYNERSEIAPDAIPEPADGAPRMSREEWQVRWSRERAVSASSAVSCYLQAAGLYNNHKARALLLRILWLLGLDDSQSTIAKAFDNYKGDMIYWYWITLIPQLLLSLSHREAKSARSILLRIAKMYPQALFYQLRVTREDFGIIKRQHAHNRAVAQRKAADIAKAAAANLAAAAKPAAGEDVVMADAEKTEAPAKEEEFQSSQTLAIPVPSQPIQPGAENVPLPLQAAPVQPPQSQGVPPIVSGPWGLVDEIMNNMKSSFPLLTLTMEKMVDQITIRAKPSADEDIYRFFAALLNDALQQWGNRVHTSGDDGELNAATKDNLIKFSSNLTGDMRNAIEKDFMRDTPSLRDYITRLQHWRDSYEKGLDARPQYQPLDQGGCNLIDFHHAKFDDVEVPGQYVHHTDHAEAFVKIARFAPRHEVARGHGHCHRRVTMIGHDTSTHTFSVQMPAARHCRREERLTQLFRILNSVLRKRKEARRRNIQFHLPAAIAMAPQLRLMENDSSYVSLQDVYDEYSSGKGRTREASIMYCYDRVKQLSDGPVQKNDQRHQQVKIEVLEEIQAKMVPETILTNYMIRTMRTPEAMWLMRKQFSLQMAGTAFLTYLCCLHNRHPNRFHFSRRTGLMYMTEILPGFAQGQPLITSSETCPFRLTPNIQNMMGRAGVEGVMTAAVTAISQSLLAPGFDLGGSLSLFVRDELLTWQATYMKDAKSDTLNKSVKLNVEHFVRRVAALGYIGPNPDKAPNAAPVVHAIVTLISQATSPNHLVNMPEAWMPWF